MLTGLAALENTDWSRLQHAYGRATDTPGHLRALLDGDSEARKRAISHLWSAILHQGTPWTATGPVALVIAGFLYDSRLDNDDSTRPALLSFLVDVAAVPSEFEWDTDELKATATFDFTPFLERDDEEFEAELYDDEDAMNALYAQALLGCIEAAPILQHVMFRGLSHSNSRLRAVAATGAVECAKGPSEEAFREKLKARLHSLALAAQDSDERSAHVLALGELGISPVEFLEDPSPAVRMCAALAPAHSNSPQALALLREMLEQHAGEIDGWFTVKPLPFTMRPRFAVVQRVVEQISDFDQLTDAAIAVAGVTSKYCVDAEWGPLLVAAFSDGTGTIHGESQRRFLEALTQNAELWDPVFGNAMRWFKKVGLPYDRTQCIALSKAP